jgi:hypothetical protein
MIELTRLNLYTFIIRSIQQLTIQVKRIDIIAVGIERM